MRRFILRWVLSAAELGVVAYLVPGVSFSHWYDAFVAAALLGFFNAVLRPIVLLLTFPISIITFGLFVFVVNAVLFWLTAALLTGFNTKGIWAPFVGALLYAVLGVVVHLLTGFGEKLTKPARGKS